MKPVLARCPLKALHCPAKLHPGLSTGAVDLRRGLHPAWIVKRADPDHYDAGHHLPLVHHRGTALGTEAPFHRLAAVARLGEPFQRSGHRDARFRQCDHCGESAAGELLAKMEDRSSRHVRALVTRMAR